MAISNLNLNVRANTSRALADFNKFSRSLDNKFLVSGLKLDVIRSALNTINRDFQRAIGEQGLASAGSLRAAQNQAALLTQTFKGFASESALAITTQIGTALNRVAVTAGGTMKDVQRTLAATPFISTNLSEDLRKQLSIGIMSAQRDMRRAGLGDNFGGIAQQFLMGRATGLQLVETGGAIESFLGAEIIKRAGGEGRIYSPEMRSEILAEILNDPDIQDQLKLMARRAAGFRIVLEDLNTQLFNTESGVFGALRKVIDRTGKSTTMFDEVNKLVESIFGKEGMFRSIFKSIEEVFGIGDPMRPLITAVQFIKGMVDEFTKFFSGPVFRDILQFSKEALSRVGDLFREIYETIRGADFSPDSIKDAIEQIGSSLREYIREFGEYIRGQDISDESGVVGGIAGTLLEEIGKTAVTVIKELLSTILNKVPEIATQVLPELNKGINAVLTEAFGEIGGKIAKIVLSFVPGPVGAVARASTAGDLTGGGGNVLSMLAMGGAALMGTGAGAKLFGAARGVGRFGYGAARTFRSRGANIYSRAADLASGAEGRMNRVRTGLFMNETDFLTRGVSRLAPRSRVSIEDPLAREIGRQTRVYQERQSLMSGLSQGRTMGYTGSYTPPPRQILPERYDIEAGRSYLQGVERQRTQRLIDQNIKEAYSRIEAGRLSRQITLPERRPRGGAMAIGSGVSGFVSAVSSPGRFVSGVRERFRPPTPIERYRTPFGETPVQTPEGGYSFADPYNDGELDLWRKGISRETAKRYNRRYGRRAVLGRRVRGIGRRFGRAGLIAGGLTAVLGAASLLGGPGSNAAEIDPETGMPKPTAAESVGGVLSGGFEGAMLGASIGSIIPGIGTAAGAVIGGVIGGVAPLMDEGIRESIGEFISNLGTTFTSAWTGFTKWIGESMSWAGEKLEEVFKLAVNGIINALNIAISAFTALPRSLIGSIEGFIKNIPLPNKEGVLGTLGSLKSFYSMQIPNFNEGKDYFGPAMAKEAMMGGRKPMVVNDGEFVIPRDGFPILAGLVGQNLRSTGVINQGESKPVMINISLSVTANSVVANAEELADTLRDPVYQIINDAWTEAYNSDKVLRTRL